MTVPWWAPPPSLLARVRPSSQPAQWPWQWASGSMSASVMTPSPSGDIHNKPYARLPGGLAYGEPVLQLQHQAVALGGKQGIQMTNEDRSDEIFWNYSKWHNDGLCDGLCGKNILLADVWVKPEPHPIKAPCTLPPRPVLPAVLSMHFQCETQKRYGSKHNNHLVRIWSRLFHTENALEVFHLVCQPNP